MAVVPVLCWSTCRTRRGRPSVPGGTLDGVEGARRGARGPRLPRSWPRSVTATVEIVPGSVAGIMARVAEVPTMVAVATSVVAVEVMVAGVLTDVVAGPCVGGIWDKRKELEPLVWQAWQRRITH